MVIESRVMNGGSAVSMQLVPCSKSNGVEDTTSEKIDLVLANGVRTYKRRRNSQSSSDNNNDVIEDVKGGAEGDGQLKAKDLKKIRLKLQARNLKELKRMMRNVNLQDGIKEQMGNISEGSCTNDHQHDFHHHLPQHDVIMLEKYDFLCKLFSESFQGIKVENLSHFKLISSRMRDGSYSRCPQLLSKDIEEIGSKFQKIGAEMISLANQIPIPEEINQIHPGNINCSEMDLDLDPDPDQPNPEKTRVCMCCGGKTDTRSCIICDSCEKIYHIFCVGVSVDKESPRSWYCMGCVSSILDPIISQAHDNCNVCDRVSITMTGESNNGLVGADIVNGGVKRTCCKLCRSEFENNQYRECEHYLCHNKFHIRCMSELELKRFGPRWYCPSCLCRVCLVDCDDEKIVLCDGCDNAYHIYCMEPPRSSIPEGKWFCRVCDARIKGIRKAKKLLLEKEENNMISTDTRSVGVYKNLEQSLKGITGRVHVGVGSVDMLLSAAETLREEEKKFVLKEA